METAQKVIQEHLRAMRTDISGIREDMHEVKQRLNSLEAGVGVLKKDSGDLYKENAAQHVRYDRLAARIEKIERRHELQ